ncbi:MAG: peptidylprolyl isomerase [Pseudomonadota bacterium]
MTLPNWTREPLVHFVTLGAIVYVALTWGGTPPDPSSRVIKVGASEREKIAESFALSMGRSPTDAELDRAIDAFVREEVLYREALRLGLDVSDAIVRRRLVSKMDLSASLAAETAKPTDAILQAFLAENTERYSGENGLFSSLSFSQLLFRSETAAREALQNTAPSGKPTSLPARMTDATVRDIEARFGEQFAQALDNLNPETSWQGPLRSGFGWHLVILSKRETQVPDFERLRPVLANDWRSDQIKRRKQRAYETLAGAYRIDIDR